jgi:hypothetical protein
MYTLYIKVQNYEEYIFCEKYLPKRFILIVRIISKVEYLNLWLQEDIVSSF